MSTNKKTGVLLINLGSPDSPSVRDVRRYLTQFLNDPLVIDINPITRFFLVNLIIVPFRAPKSARLYEKIWTNEGSPLISHSIKQKELLQHELGENFIVELGMRYQNPSIELAYKNLVEQDVEQIIALPLYPQWASSSSESSIVELKRIMNNFKRLPVRTIEKFYDHSGFLSALQVVANKYDLQSFDHIVFSYHGLPERQIKKIYQDHCQLSDDCCSTIGKHNELCYRAACFHTTRELVRRLNIPEGKYTTSFQSRLNDKWLKPYSDKVIEDKAKSGVKKILVFSPAFVADCLETIYELGEEYRHIFQNNGGEQYEWVKSLNEEPRWISALSEMIKEDSAKLIE